MKDVYTAEDLKKSLENKETCVLHGEIAQKIIKKYKVKQACKWGGIIIAVAGVIAIPFTGGASGLVAAEGFTAALTVEASAAELLILVGGGAAIYGIHKNCKVEIKSDGTVIVTPK